MSAAKGGVYVLIVKLARDSKISTSKKVFSLKSGVYIYVGSAVHSLGQLIGRIKRHLRKNKKKHWHIDYLLESKNAKITRIILSQTSRKIECELSRKISNNAMPIEEFGSTDCRKCKAHLYYADSVKRAEEIAVKCFKSLNLRPTIIFVENC